MGYTAKAIARRYGRHSISPLQLQKLVYIVQGS